MKISIVGMGRVGVTLAYTVLVRGLASELVLVSRNRNRAEGEALDLEHARAFTAQPTRICAGNVEESRGSDVIVLCCSAPYHEGIKTRFDLGPSNLKIFRETIPPLVSGSPKAKILVISNPTEVMTYHALKISGFDPSRVFGTGTLIDSARLRSRLSQKAAIHPEDVRAYMLGEHGDGQFATLSTATAGGSRIELDESVQQMVDHVRQSGHEVLHQKGHSNFAICMAASVVLEAMAFNSLRTMPLSILVDGFLGEKDVCLSLPVVVGRSGITRKLLPELSAEETTAFHHAAEIVRKGIQTSESTPLFGTSD